MAVSFRTDWDSPPNEKYDLWTITNASEIVPGVLTPLLASWVAHAEREAFRQVVDDYLGGEKIPMAPHPVPNFAGFFGGRIGLNMGLAAAILSLVDPGIGEAVLQGFFTGISGTERYIVPTTEEERAATAAALEKIRAGAERRLDESRERLYAERATDRYERDSALSMAEAFSRQQELTDEAIRLFNTHLHVSLAASEYQVKLGGVLDAGAQPPELVIPLCSGLGEVESSKPAIGLYDLAQKAKAWPRIARTIRKQDAKTVLATMGTPPDPAWRAFAAAFRRFLYRYGYRVQGEFDPSMPDWNEEPTFAMSQVRSMLAVRTNASPRALLKKAKAERLALQRSVRRSMPKEMRSAFDATVREAQRFTRMREYSKAMWILGQRRGRAVYLAMAAGLVRAGQLKERDELRFLTYDEMRSLCRGGIVEDVAGKIARRKSQYGEADDIVLPDSWFGMPEMQRKTIRRRTKRLEGLGVSGGQATGKARIVLDTLAAVERDIAPGEILVAPFTDAPWTPLFIPAGAVVVETGGVLSHAATVAREFGIPCVVMVKDATSIIREGETVTVDGTAGTVLIAS